MLTIRYHSSFKRDYKSIIKRGYDIRKLSEVISMIAEEQILPSKYRNHALSGKYSHCFECHISPDWLLIYEIDNRELLLILTRTGTHSDLF